MTAQVLQFRPRATWHKPEGMGVGDCVIVEPVAGGPAELPSDVEQDACSCPSCREPSNVIPQPKEEPFAAN